MTQTQTGWTTDAKPDNGAYADTNALHIPGETHYSVFATPKFAATIAPFLSEGSN